MKKIMLVDDDEKITSALKIRLQSSGYQVYVAMDPVRGMGMIVKERPDLIVLDLSMPAGGGLFLAERLRKLPAYEKTPIVILTASQQIETRERAGKIGVNAYFEKPFESKELLQAISQQLA